MVIGRLITHCIYDVDSFPIVHNRFAQVQDQGPKEGGFLMN